jgi:hypothetical protein
MKKRMLAEVLDRWCDEKFRRRIEDAKSSRNHSSEELSDIEKKGIKLKTDWRSLR